MNERRPRRAALAALARSARCSRLLRQHGRPAALRPLGEAKLFADGKVLQAPPPGTIARDDPGAGCAALSGAAAPDALALLRARAASASASTARPATAMPGYGDGTVPSRGFPHPPSFHRARLRGLPSRHVFDVITNGYGVMYSYAARVPPADRWAIAAYIRRLQVSQGAQAERAPPEDRELLERRRERGAPSRRGG